MFANFTEAMLELFVTSLWETIVMVGISGVVGALLGIPLGVFLRLTDHGGVLENGPVNKLVGWVVNAVRSTPFIILLVAIIPFTRLITGSSIGTAAAVVPLTLAAAPFIARLVETALREVDNGLVEAAQSMGATTSQIVWKVLLPEALPGIVAGLTISFVSLTGYSAMAGAIGGGGLGPAGERRVADGKGLLAAEAAAEPKGEIVGNRGAAHGRSLPADGPGWAGAQRQADYSALPRPRQGAAPRSTTSPGAGQGDR